MTEFTLTTDHLKLLRLAHVGWNGEEFGAPTIDPKRPYGAGDVVRSIASILGWEFDPEVGVTDPMAEAATNLHHELRVALQITLVYAGEAVRPGLYRLAEKYSSRSWYRVDGQ